LVFDAAVERQYLSIGSDFELMSIPINAAVLTASDTRKLADDLSGAELVRLLTGSGVNVVEHRIVPDDLMTLRETIYGLANRDDINLVLTTGGTGLSPRDNTPEATRAVIDREVPGISEAMRRETAAKTPMAMLSRGIAGIRNGTLIINFPGSPKAVSECFDVVRPVLQHAIDLIGGRNAHPK
jgi:molybdenum cofactor synthesis domain-containing protein